MRKSGFLLLLGLTFSLCPARSSAQMPVRMLFFYSMECEDCQAMKESLLPELQNRYGEHLEIRFLEVTEPGNYATLSKLEEEFGHAGAPVPVVYLCKQIIGGPQEVTEKLQPAIEEGLRSGGCDWPQVTVTPPPQPGSGQKIVHMAYFYEPGCRKCDRVNLMLEHFQRVHPMIELRRYNLHDGKSKELEEAMAEIAGLAETRRLLAPTVFVGHEALVQDEVKDAALGSLLEKYAVSGTRPPWDEAELRVEAARRGILQRFKGIGPLTVVSAAILDSLNPCAITTLVFLIAYLSFMGRKGRSLLVVGGAFAGGVFIAYLGVGLGLLRLVQAASGVVLIRRVLYGLLGVAVLVFSVLSFVDGLKSRRGGFEDIKLQLPFFLKRRIHATIRSGVHIGRFAIGAALTGIVVSVLEFACTGQMYFPVIAYIAGRPGLRANAIPYLLLYNVVFILPLAVVFLAARYGSDSEAIARFTRRHIASVKMATAVVFLVLGVFLIKIAAVG